jgi:Ca2+-binding EF-hand superfamily protein
MVEDNFARFDKNSDGFLEVEEFHELVNCTFKDMASQMMTRFDLDKNKRIGKQELYKAYKDFFGVS